MSHSRDLRPTALPKPGDILLGRYVIEGVLTRGGFATIYRGRQLGVERTVAIKCLDPDSVHLDPAAPQRFAREARLASGLQHPNTITIFDYGRTETGVLFLVMEFVEGVSLNRILRYGRIDPNRATHLVTQILHSLREAHARDIIHRDLKPANIMVCDQAEEHDVVKVLDFGIAKALGDRPDSRNLTAELTGTDRVIGTPRYMSPEQLQGERVSPASDLYSVGLIFYEMLVGQPAIDKPTSLENMTAQMSDDPIPIPADQVPRELLSVLRKLIDKDPRRRYQAADGVIKALEGRIVGQVKVGDADDEGATRPIDLDERREAQRALSGSFSRPTSDSAVHPSAAYAASMWYGRPRLLLMFNVMLAVLLVAVGVTLGMFLVTGLRDRSGTSVEESAVSQPVTTTTGSVVVETPAPARSLAPPAPAPVPSAPGPIHPAPVAPALSLAAEPPVEPPGPSLETRAAQVEVHDAALMAANTAEPLVFVFNGSPADAELYLGPDRLGQAGQPVTIERQRLPIEVEIRHPGHRPELALLTSNTTGTVSYVLEPLPAEVPTQTPAQPTVLSVERVAEPTTPSERSSRRERLQDEQAARDRESSDERRSRRSRHHRDRQEDEESALTSSRIMVIDDYVREAGSADDGSERDDESSVDVSPFD